MPTPVATTHGGQIRSGRVALALLLVLSGVFGIGAAAGLTTGTPWLPDWLLAWDRASAGHPREPVRVTIPALDVDAPVRPVGLDRQGAIAAPPLARAQEAGWYEDGPAPGQSGAAVIVGHVDGPRGPAVFHGLPTLPPGARIEVTGAGGQVHTFEVSEVRAYDKQALPPDEVYGDYLTPELRLITCGGPWVGGQQGYAQNIVVFAELVRPTR